MTRECDAFLKEHLILLFTQGNSVHSQKKVNSMHVANKALAILGIAGPVDAQIFTGYQAKSLKSTTPFVQEQNKRVAYKLAGLISDSSTVWAAKIETQKEILRTYCYFISPGYNALDYLYICIQISSSTLQCKSYKVVVSAKDDA